MRVESSSFAKGLHHRDHARAEGVVLASGRYHQLFHRLVGGPRQLAQKLATGIHCNNGYWIFNDRNKYSKGGDGERATP